MTAIDTPKNGDPRPVRRSVHVRAPHGVKPRLVVTLYPDGTIGLREQRRPASTEQRLELGELYVRAIDAACRRAERLAREYQRSGMTRAEARAMARRKENLA